MGKITSFYRLSVKDDVMFVGDLHGYIADFADEIVAKTSNSLIFVVGDIGLGMFNPSQTSMELCYLEDICRKKDNIVVCIRGNHDNPAFFDSLEKKSKSLSDYLQHVLLVPDYTIIETSKGNVLCVGGAISVDRNLREMKTSDYDEGGLIWFSDEDVKFIDLEPIEELVQDDEEGYETLEDMNPFAQEIKNKNISIILSHTAPICAWPSPMNASHPDSGAINGEREYLQKLGEYINSKGNNIKKWIYGHFHHHNVSDIDNIEYRCLQNFVSGYNPDVYELH